MAEMKCDDQVHFGILVRREELKNILIFYSRIPSGDKTFTSFPFVIRYGRMSQKEEN